MNAREFKDSIIGSDLESRCILLIEGSVYSAIKPELKIRDPIYGFIWLNNNERKLIDTKVYQRLRRIKQLAFTNYVYPAAEHSRFIHSLGVLQAATEIFQMLYNENQDYIKKYGEIEDIIKILRYTALLHDIGHLPFSHASEDALLKEKKKHEQIGSYIIENHPDIKNILKNDGIEPKIISTLIASEHIPSNLEIVKKIISGEFDADRTDYLLRDSYMCGVEYGLFDYKRFIDSFILYKDDGQILPLLAIKEANMHAVEALVLARYHYYTQVVFHRTRNGYDIAFKHYLEEEFQEESENLLNDEIDFCFWEDFDDCYVFNRIKEDALKSNKWAEILLRLKHMKTVYSTGSHATDEEKRTVKRIKKDLREKGYKEGEHFFVVPLSQEIHKLTSSSDEGTSKEKTIHIIDRKGNKKGDILEYSGLLRKFREPINIFRIYTTDNFEDQIKKEIDAIVEDEKSINQIPL